MLIFVTFGFIVDILFADFQFIFDPDANVRETQPSSSS